MPVGNEVWEAGSESRSRYNQILELLEENPRKAFSVQEVCDHLGFTDEPDRSIVVDRLVQMHVSCKLERLVYDGDIAVRRVYGEKHYRINPQ
ncbi:hypothetical protein [Natronorarus salvus]|uniref:hypothetical protein n=1 Tax=Natronorarus salvus TaxID=3117733 RepID=UPI002F268363